jgi:hypothetical protein
MPIRMYSMFSTKRASIAVIQTAVSSRANAAAHMAFAVYDHYRFALAYLQVRIFLLDMAFFDTQAAYSAMNFAAVNTLAALAASGMNVAAGFINLEEGFGAALLAFGTAIAGVQAAISIGDWVEALDVSIDSLEEAMAARIEAEVWARKMFAAANETARYAVELDAKGLLP